MRKIMAAPVFLKVCAKLKFCKYKYSAKSKRRKFRKTVAED